MEIKEYLVGIGVPVSDENQINSFLASKEPALKTTILKLWNEFQETEAAKSNAKNATESEKKLSTKSNIPPTVSTADNQETKENVPVISNEPATVPEIIKPTEFKPTTDIDQKKPVKQEQPTKEDTKEKQANDALLVQIKNKYITLPNGKVNQPYYFKFEIEKIGIPEIGDFLFDGLDKIGLNFIDETDEIKGTPTLPGDHKIVLKCKRKDWTEGKPVFEREITLIINPDPKSLWNNIPTPKDIEYYKEDEKKSFLKVPSTGFINKEVHKDMVAASQRGRSHAHEGKARDDDFNLFYNKTNEWYIMTVADGAGSAKSSRKGSEIACKTVIEECNVLIEKQCKNFDNLIKEYSYEKTEEKRKKLGDALYGIIGTSVFKAYKNIEEEAKNTNKPIKDFSTTLILSISKKFKFGWFVGAFWVGDGAIGIYKKEDQFIRLLGESDGGEFAGQTRFLTMPEIIQSSEIYRRLRFDIVNDFTALILMTDGVSDPKFETDANLLRVEKWNELWEDISKEVEFKRGNEKSAEQLLKWLDFWSAGNHDDRTIAILY